MVIDMTDSKPLNFPYSIPDGVRVYAIGDLHGHLDALQAMHIKIDQHLSENPIEKTIVVYLGDYIDRGPDSAQIIEYLSILQQETSSLTRYFIKGNHEWKLQEYMESSPASGAVYMGGHFLMWGGLETLASYGVDIPDHITQDSIVRGEVLPAEYERLSEMLNEKVPTHHHDFLNSLDLHVQIGDYLFVHAGIRPNVPLEKQSLQDLMCIRGIFTEHKEAHEYRIVHGHEISNDVVIEHNHIGVDTGLYMSGCLSCVALEKNQVEVLQIKKEISKVWTRPKV